MLLGLADTRALDALEPLDTFQATTFRSAVGLIGYIVLDRPDCQYAAKTVTKESCVWPSSWCPTVNPSGPVRRMTCQRSMWCMDTQTGQARIHDGALQELWNSSESIPLSSAPQLNTSSLSVGSQSCMQRDVWCRPYTCLDSHIRTFSRARTHAHSA